MYHYQVSFPCTTAHDKRFGYATVAEARGIVSDHKLNFVKGILTLYVTVQTENERIFKEVLHRLAPDAILTLPKRGGRK